jgi:hypothetical protein
MNFFNKRTCIEHRIVSFSSLLEYDFVLLRTCKPKFFSLSASLGVSLFWFNPVAHGGQKYIPDSSTSF